MSIELIRKLFIHPHLQYIWIFIKKKLLSAQPAWSRGDCPRWWNMTLWGSLHLPSSGSTGLLTKHFQGWWIIASAGPWWGAVLTINWKSLINLSPLSCSSRVEGLYVDTQVMHCLSLIESGGSRDIASAAPWNFTLQGPDFIPSV